MDGLKLVIGNKNYSSWSLRAWFLMSQAGIEFEEIRLALDTERFHREILRYNAAGRVPVLCHGDVRIPDSLAVAEYLAELSRTVAQLLGPDQTPPATTSSTW